MKNTIKTCKHCGPLSIKEVILNKKSNQYNCKYCHYQRVKNWYEKNKDKKKIHYEKWLKNNPERAKELKKKTWEKNRENNLIKSKEKYQKNKEKLSKNALKKYHKNPLVNANSRFKRLYKITLDEYNKMFEKQNGLCAICKNPEKLKDNKKINFRRLAVDHCHKTNKIRELVCFRCNVILGKINDSEDLLTNFINYLKKHI